MQESGSESAGGVSPRATQWKYLVTNIHARHNNVLEEHLNERGHEGWELVFMSEPQANEFRCVFRRAEP